MTECFTGTKLICAEERVNVFLFVTSEKLSPVSREIIISACQASVCSLNYTVILNSENSCILR
jgi:hypothetical protein